MDLAGITVAEACAAVPILNPAAIAWPPPFTSNPAWRAAITVLPRSTPSTERPDPLPVSPSNPITKVGRL